ncbi:hypothetical protein LQ567_16910 [Niabella pedocola]|uniref:Type II and III secretion system protein n=1 Tax=Niabella pedocola TaxID=1752077 RepID=A0ABS8PVY8_9BACT|nr:secretin N-terminal domain-containing protein [Niabella pedocola]MCD2424463.1 hypothetical protein [Niabella pedocola]
MKRFYFVLIFFMVCCLHQTAMAQQDRLMQLRNILTTLSMDLPGLNQQIQMDVADISIADFMRGLAQSYKLNINIAPDVNKKMTNHFSNTLVRDVLVFIADQYSLAYDFQGTIINVKNYRDPKLDLPPPPKVIKADYNTSTKLLSLDLSNDTLYDVTKKITQLTGVNIAVMPASINKLVSGYVKDLPVGEALGKIAVSNRIKMTSSGGDNFILDALQDDEEYVLKNTRPATDGYTISRKTGAGDKNAPGRMSIDANQVGDEKLLNVSAVNTPLKELVKSLSAQAGVAYFIYAELNGNVTAEAHNLRYAEVLQKILLGTPYSFSQQDGIYMIGEKNFEGIRAQRLIQLHHRSVDSLVHFLPDDLKKDISVKEFKELNAFLATGPEPQLNKVEQLVKQLDRKVPLITIEVIIMDINKGSVVKAGLKAGISDSMRTGGNLLGGGLDFTLGSRSINNIIDKIGLNNVFNLGHVTPNFYLQLQAIENRQNVEMRQTPKLSTLNGHAASLSIGNTRYYEISTQNTLGSLNPTIVSTKQFNSVEANLELKITPFVSADEDVTLNMEMDISNFTADTKINEPPPTATSKFKSIIRVKNDDMVLLGGIERTEKGDSYDGIPLLGRIPVLKWLFSSRNRRNVKVVSVVFIKPTIVYN